MAQTLSVELMGAAAGTSAGKAMTLLTLPDGDPNRGLARRVLDGMARHVARHTMTVADRERPSGMLTMGAESEQPMTAPAAPEHRDAVDAALAADGPAVRCDPDNAHRINAAVTFAAAMGSAEATHRDAGSADRVANVARVRRTREQTIGGRSWDATGQVRLIRETSLESLLTHTMRTHGAHGDTVDPADRLTVRLWTETFLTGPTAAGPTSGAQARRLADRCDRLSGRGARNVAALTLACHGARMTGAQYAAWHAVATGQVRSWGTLVAAAVATTTPRKRGKGRGHVAAVTAGQSVTRAAGDGPVMNATRETSRVVWATVLALLGERSDDSAARRTAVAMTDRLAVDAGAVHGPSRSHGGRHVITVDRLAAPTTRGGVAPWHRGDDMAPWRSDRTAPPSTLRIARHATVDTRKVRPPAWTDPGDTSAPFRGDPPPRDPATDRPSAPIWWSAPH